MPRTIGRLFLIAYLALPWIIEAGSYGLIFPMIVPIFGGFAWPIFVAEFIVGSYADRRLWIRYTRRDANADNVLTSAVWPIGLCIAATIIFGATASLLAVLPKVLLFAVIVSVLKYLVWELQNLRRQ